jgi:hypothetical protein
VSTSSSFESSTKKSKNVLSGFSVQDSDTDEDMDSRVTDPQPEPQPEPQLAVPTPCEKCTSNEKHKRLDWSIWQRVFKSPEAKLWMSDLFHNYSTPGNSKMPGEPDPRTMLEVLETTSETHMNFVRFVHKLRHGIIVHVNLARNERLMIYGQIILPSSRRMTSKLYTNDDIPTFKAGSIPCGSIMAYGCTIPWAPAIENAARENLTMTPIVVLLDGGKTIQLEFPHEGFDTWMRVRIACHLDAEEPKFPEMASINDVYDYEAYLIRKKHNEDLDARMYGKHRR